MSSIEAAHKITQLIQILAKDARSADLQMTVAALEFAASVVQADVDRICQPTQNGLELQPDTLGASGN